MRYACALIAVIACTLVTNGISAVVVDNNNFAANDHAAALRDGVATTQDIVLETQDATEKNGRTEAAANAVVDHAVVAASSVEATDADGAAQAAKSAAMNGPAPVVVLATGGTLIAIVALAFQKRRTRKLEREEKDPMKQSLLFHDMDYAAM